jgi:hypothetical protein
MGQQFLLMKERRLLFGYKKSAQFISTSCAPRCEKSQLRKNRRIEGRWQTAWVVPGIRSRRDEDEAGRK